VAGCHIRQELPGTEVADTTAQVKVPVEFIPGVTIDFCALMAACSVLLDTIALPEVL